MKKIRNNKGVKPKWMNGESKRLIKGTKIAYQKQKTNLSEENHQRYKQLLQSKKGEIRKSKEIMRNRIIKQHKRS